MAAGLYFRGVCRLPSEAADVMCGTLYPVIFSNGSTAVARSCMSYSIVSSDVTVSEKTCSGSASCTTATNLIRLAPCDTVADYQAPLTVFAALFGVLALIWGMRKVMGYLRTDNGVFE